MRDSNNKSFIKILSDIYDLAIDAEEHDFPNDFPGIDKIRESYDIDSESVLVLAYLLHAFPGRVAESTLESVLAGIDVYPDRIYKQLMYRNLITCDEESESYRLTSPMYEALCKNAPYGYVSIEDCYEELKNCSPSNYYSKPWLNGFYKAMEKPVNEQLLMAVETIGIRNYPADIQSGFWNIAHFFVNNFLTPMTLGDGDIMKHCLKVLVNEGLVIVPSNDSAEDYDDEKQYILAPKIAGLLFHGHDEIIRYDEISKFANIIKARDIDEKQLFFSPEAQEDASHLCKMLSETGFMRACKILKNQKRNPAIQSLFWGPPGTGKTEIVKQIARESSRDVILFDVSKVTASGWGATERLYRALFRDYNYIAEISSRVPILLMNEADAVLSRRITSIDRAIDKAENAVSNILLQEFEDMSGILLATTNLITNLDDAFDRRFLFKTHMENPDAKARASIWRSVIQSLSDEEAIILAEKFEMSGAQINNVATKRNLAELYYDGDRGVAYIEKLCQDELASEKGNNTNRKKIGF